MNVKLISVTASFIPGIATPEDLIVYCARVSSPKNQFNTPTGPKLLKYCINHGHWSVFEQVSMGVEIKTSRAIAAQILRHRSFTFQEFSQRYAEVDPQVEISSARSQSDKNRQGSSSSAPDDVKEWFDITQQYNATQSFFLYKEALAKGISREQARLLLPLGTSTTLYMYGTIRSWIHYLQTRGTEDTQFEHREIAAEIALIFKDQFPNIYEALNDA